MIDVIMPVWIVNEELLQLTKNAIESLGKVNLIIIDNASPVGGGYLRSVANLYVRNQENLGYAKAVNQGLKLSKNKLKAIANNDIRVSSNWQEIAREVFAGDDKAYSCHFRMIGYDEPFNPGSITAYTGKERWCSSSFFVIRATTPQLYNEHYVNSYDDWDYWYRVRNNGWKTAYTNKAEYQHKDSSTQQYNLDREERDKKNREYFKSIHYVYPEDHFARTYPEQTQQNWRPFP